MKDALKQYSRQQTEEDLSERPKPEYRIFRKHLGEKIQDVK
jgi:hypothetical protein